MIVNKVRLSQQTNPIKIELFDQRQQIWAHNLKDHTDVLSIRSNMFKKVDELYHPLISWTSLP